MEKDNPECNLLSESKKRLIDWADRTAVSRHIWRNKNSYFHQLDEQYLRFLVPEGLRVLALGCGTGVKLSKLSTSYGLGVDISSKKIEIATNSYEQLEFIVGDVEDPDILSKAQLKGPFDVILLDDTLGFIEDIQKFLTNLQQLCSENTRIISVYYAFFWEPIMKAAERMGLRMPTVKVTWLRMSDIENFMAISGLETVKKEWRILLPRKCLGLGPLLNKYIGVLPVIRKLALRHYLIARRKPQRLQKQLKVTVVIPCRNEKGNIEDAVTRIPNFSHPIEILFVEGHSKDETWDEIKRVQKKYPDKTITAIKQPGEGKGDAVRAAFSIAKGEILIILDGDLTVPPEDLPKFYEALVSGKGEFINGTRLVYPMENEAMRFLNHIANRCFAQLFSFLLNQSYTDTLCGTKALTKQSYQKIALNREYFGDFDPFGDFDLIFGAAKLNLKVVEIPIRYRSRQYGATQISRFRHGILLVRMVVFAFRKLKVL